MKIFKFRVKFLTPLFIGGEDSRNLDENGLSGKALRGSWRFWCRAMLGGMLDDYEYLHELESKIFGSADRKCGAKFRLLIEKEDDTHCINNCILGFEDKIYGEPVIIPCFAEGASYSITIIPREEEDEVLIPILFSTIWLWGNLGSIGKRARRGFGSPVLYLEDGSGNPFNSTRYGIETRLPIRKDPFNRPDELRDHLRTGIINVWSTYKQWINSKSTIEGDISNLPAPTNAPFFILNSMEQIALGNQGYEKINDAVTAVHGRNSCKGLGWVDGNRKMASPVYIRFHKVMEEDREVFFPIFTWCKQHDIETTEAHDYLTKIFTRNLMEGPI